MDNRDLNGNEVNEDLSAVDPSLTENEESTALITPDEASEENKLQLKVSGSKDRYYELFDKNKQKTMAWSVMSMIFGICSIICCCYGWLGLVLSVISIAFAVVSRVNLKYFDGMAIAGLIIGIFGLVFSLTVLVSMIIVGTEEFNSIKDKFFGGEYPTLPDVGK